MALSPKHQPTLFSTHRLLLIVAVFVIFSACAWASVSIVYSAAARALRWYTGADNTLPAVTEGTNTADIPQQYYRLLDGAPVPEDETSRWPVAVMIENLPVVRPQSGLTDAYVVYEALAEGGATRFMAIFDPQEVATKKIGPVRSSRPYYLEWLGEYDGLYAHAGGSPKALTVIREAGVRDLEALGRDGKYYYRDRSQSAPHNLYTDAEKLTLALRDKNLLDEEATYLPWTFRDGADESDRGEDAQSIVFNFSSGLSYKVTWTYMRATNTYKRFNADKLHTDANTGDQLEAQNVIIQLVDEPELDGTGKGRLDIYVGGTGDAWVAHDGHVIKATWKKPSRTDRTRFYDVDGNEIELVRGKTWIHVVTKTQDVTVE